MVSSKSININGYVLAKDSDFKWESGFPWYGAWHYVGKDDKVIIPHSIQGKEVTSYRYMFYETSVSGVYSNNENITDMSYMFSYSKATSLDLTYLDTSNVTDMSAMFWGSNAKTLDLSTFNPIDTSNIIAMFWGGKVKTLHTSSFNARNVNSMSKILSSSKIRVGFARSKENADYFNSLSKLTFEIIQ